MANPDEILRDQAERLRRGYRQPTRPLNGLNGGQRQTLTRPEQFDAMLNGFERIADTAVSELERREQREPGTLIGMGRAGPDQIARMRQLNRATAGGESRNGNGRDRRRGNGSRGPGVGLGRRHINSGQSKPTGGMRR